MLGNFNLILSVIIYLASNLVLLSIIGRIKTKRSLAPEALGKLINKYWFILNLAGGLCVGVFISFSVLFTSEPEYFLMPIFFAPFGYWLSFSIPILLVLFSARYWFLKKGTVISLKKTTD